MAAGELVIYYAPERTGTAVKLKGVLVQMGVRMKTVTEEQTGCRVGFLAGLPGFEETDRGEAGSVDGEVLVMKNFSGKRMDELFLRMRKAGIPGIALKAVLTQQNVSWTFYELYRELQREHSAMSAMRTGDADGQKG